VQQLHVAMWPISK